MIDDDNIFYVFTFDSIGNDSTKKWHFRYFKYVFFYALRFHLQLACQTEKREKGATIETYGGLSSCHSVGPPQHLSVIMTNSSA